MATQTGCVNLEKIGRALVGDNLASIPKAVHVCAHDEIRKLLLLRFFELIDQECAVGKTQELFQDSVILL